MREPTWGPIVEKRVRKFLEELLYCATGAKHNDNIQVKWENENSPAPMLQIKSKRRFLQKNADFKEGQNHYFTESIEQLKNLGILEDRRMIRQGSEEWHFALKLWSQDTTENLIKFDQEWDKKRPKINTTNSHQLDENLSICSVSGEFKLIANRYDIERQPQESQWLDTILQSGSFLRIKGPRYIGKKRVLNRLLAKVQQAQENTHIVILNWQNNFDSTVFSSYDNFLENFCAAVSNYLELPDNLDKYWTKRGTPNNKTTTYFLEYVLPKIESRLILVLEAIDLVFKYPSINQDFCGLLRGWHESSRRSKLWHKLSLVIVHSTDKYATLDIQMSPLANVGETITIEEFTRLQVDELVGKYEVFLTDVQITKLIQMSNGHPFLVDHALKLIAKQSITLEEILAKATTLEGIYKEHLLELWNILQNNPPLKEVYKKVVTESVPASVKPDLLFQLQSMGLVRVNGDFATPQCQLYRQYFAKYL
jgi:serine/threonine-protein kinase